MIAASCTLVASVTISVTAVVVVYTDVRCPNCSRRVMSLPGRPLLDIQVRRTDADRSGRGAVVGCARCKALLEVIQHGREAA
jgi:DNA-directed RNA polymerase subunit RPC12/RpoP